MKTPLQAQLEMKKLALADKMLTKQNIIEDLQLQQLIEKISKGDKEDIDDETFQTMILQLMNSGKLDMDKLLMLFAIRNNDPKWILFQKLMESGNREEVKKDEKTNQPIIVRQNGNNNMMLMMMLLMMMMQED